MNGVESRELRILRSTEKKQFTKRTLFNIGDNFADHMYRLGKKETEKIYQCE